jgi:protein TonB
MYEVSSPAVAAMQEERSGYILLLLAILVLMLHVFGIAWLRQPPVAEQTSSPQPFKLEVTMLSTFLRRNTSAMLPSPNLCPSPHRKSRQSCRRRRLKIIATSLQPLDSRRRRIKIKLFSKKAQNQRNTLPHQSRKSIKSQSTLQTRQTVSSAMIQNPSKQTHAKDNFIADELHNPSPEYPEMAVFLGYQGNAFVQIFVSANGVSERVKILKSSGHKILDDSAANALKNWRFIPSKRGEKAVPDSVIISVVFTLH